MQRFRNTISIFDKEGKSFLVEWKQAEAVELLKFVRLALTSKDRFFDNTLHQLHPKKRSISELGKFYKKLTLFASLSTTAWSFSPLLTLFFDQYHQHRIRDFPFSFFLDEA